MIGFATKAAISMIKRPARHSDRSWGAEFLCRTMRNAFKAGEDMPIERFRKIIEGATTPHPALAKVAIEEHVIKGVPCLTVQEQNVSESTRVLIYFHGGGYVVGSPRAYKAFIAQLAVESKSKVIAPDYRLAPDHRFPAPQEDCLAVAQHVFSEYPQQQKILAGDSAGGTLALMCALELAEMTPQIQADNCVLLSPWIDPAANTGSMISNQNHDFLTVGFLEKSLKALMNDANYTNPRINFRDADVKALPPTLIQCGETELFSDQIQAFSKHANEQGTNITLQSFAGQFHVFQVVAPMLKASKSAMRSITDFLNQD